MSTKKITLKIAAPHEYDDVDPQLIAEDLMPDNVEWELLSEPVYTQSEVVTMLKEMEDAVECVDVGSYVFCGVPSDKLNIIAAKHGIVLDPL